MKVLRKNGEIVEVSFEEQEGKKHFGIQALMYLHRQ